MAYYTVLTDGQIKKLLAAYDIGTVFRIREMSGGQANSSYKIESGKDTYILSICDEKGFDQIDALTRILEHLEASDFLTNRLVKTKDGDRFTHFEKKPVYLKTHLEGQIVKDLTPAMIEQIGEAMAKLHRVPPLNVLPDSFPYGMDAFEEISHLDHPYVGWIQSKKAYLQTALDLTCDRCFIHGDIFWDNVLFNRGRLSALLDFEEACHYYRLYDIGMCVVGCCSDNGVLNPDKTHALIRGYKSISERIGSRLKPLKAFIEYAATAGSFWRFRQYNVRYPDSQKANSYKELSDLADHIHEMSEDRFSRIFNGLKTTK